MKKTILLSSLLSLLTACQSEKPAEQKLNPDKQVLDRSISEQAYNAAWEKKLEHFSQYFPAGYEVFSLDTGNLNHDEYPDILLIANDTNEER